MVESTPWPSVNSQWYSICFWEQLLLKAATLINSINGFNVSGIYPLNRTIFQAKEFSSSTITYTEISSDASQIIISNIENVSLQVRILYNFEVKMTK